MFLPDTYNLAVLEQLHAYCACEVPMGNLNFRLILFVYTLVGIYHIKCSIESIDETLESLSEAFQNDNESAVPDILHRVRIFSEIYNEINYRYKNLTNEPGNIRDTSRACTNRIRQLSDFKRLSLDYLEREVGKKRDGFRKIHQQVQSRKLQGLDIAENMLPYILVFGFFCEKINDLFVDKKIQGQLEKNREDSLKIIQADFTKDTEIHIYNGWQELLDYVMEAYNDKLKTTNMVDMLMDQTGQLNDLPPEEVQIFSFQFMINKGLYVTKKLLTVLIQCEAIFENVKDPFTRENNTMDDQQSHEFFGTFFEGYNPSNYLTDNAAEISKKLDGRARGRGDDDDVI